MKQNIVVAVVLSAGIVSGAPAQNIEKVELLGCDACAAGKRAMGQGQARAMLEHALTIGRGTADERAVNNTSTDLTSYDLDIAIDPTARTISGSNVLSFTALQSISTVQVRLSSAFTVSTTTGVQVNGSNATFSRSGITMTVNLGRTYAPGEAFSVKVTYSGTPTSGGFGSITFRTRSSGAREAFTLSETDYAHTWFPAKENNLDKCTANMRFTVPNTMKAVSNGTLVSTTPATSNRLTYHWRTDYPTATYLYCFSVTNHNTFGATWNFTPGSGPSVSMPVNFWIYPESDTTNNRNAWLKCVDMLTAFSPEGRFGLYPFSNEKYGMYQFGFGGGMEHQTCTGQGVFDESVTAHELGHQWWGDNVTCATWNHIWLNEGFATYSEAVWEEWKPGSTGLPALKAAMAARKPGSVNGTVWSPSTTDMNRIFSSDFSYRKGGWVLHMLRKVMGDADFFTALRNYRTQYAFGSATTEEFQAVCEAVEGQSLNWFFQQWIYQPGAPTYQFGWRNVAANGQNYLEVYFNQTQTGTYPRYRMPIDARISPQTSAAYTQVIVNDAGTEHLLIPVTGPIGNLVMDTDGWILNTGITYISMPEGPPKVVATGPAPGASTTAVGASVVTVNFHKNVNAASDAFSLSGPSGPVPFTFAYDAAAFRATLTPSAPLTPGLYTLGVSTGVTDVASSKALDGETPSSSTGGTLPSGDGVPGGAFAINFTILPPPACDADLNSDGSVNTADLAAILSVFGQSVTPGAPGDLNDDGTVDTADLAAFLGAFGTSCP